MAALAQMSVLIDAQTATFTRKIDEAARKLRSDFRTASEQATSSVTRMSAQYTAQAAQIQRATTAMTAQIQSAQRAFAGLAAGFVGVAGISRMASSIVDASNKMIGFRQSLAATTGSAANASRELAFIRAETARLGTSFEASAPQFAKLTAATRGTSLAGEETRKIFTSISEAARVLNLTTEQVEGAFRALEQMVSKGNVQAEELRGQLGERLPGAFRIAAEALGVTTAELDKMLKAGQVTAEDLLPKLSARIHELYGAASTSAANSPAAQFERLRNSIFELNVAIGNAGFMDTLAAGATSVTRALTGLVQSGAVDTLVSSLGTIAQAGALAFSGRLIGSIGDYAKAQIAAASASVEAANAERAKALAWADTQKRQAAVAELNARLAAQDLERAKQAAQVAIATEAEAKAALDLAKANGTATASVEALAAAESARVKALSAVGAAQAAAVKANVQLYQATQRYSAAVAEVPERVTALSTAMGGLQRIGSSLFAMIGGWPTVILAAGYALYKLWDAMHAGDERMQESIESLRQYNEQMEQVRHLEGIKSSYGVDSRAAEGISMFERASQDAARLRQEIDAANQRIQELSRSTREGADGAILALSSRIENLNRQLAESQKEITRFASDFDNLPPALQNVITSAEEAADSMLRMFGIMGGSGQAVAAVAESAAEFSEETKKFIADMNKRAETAGLGSEAMIRYEASVRAAAAGSREEAEAIILAADAAANAVSAAEAASSAHKGASSASREYAKEQRELKRQQEELARAQEEFADNLLDMEAAMSGPLAVAQRKYAAEVTKAWQAHLKGEASYEDFIRYQKLMQAELEKTTAGLAKQGDIVAQLNADFAADTAYIGMSDRQRAIAEAVNEATEAWTRNTEANIANAQTLEDVQRKAAELAANKHDLNRFWEEQTAQAEKFASIVRNAFDSMVDAIAEWAVNGFKNAKEFWNSMVDMLKRAVAQMLAEWAKTKIIGWFTGTSTGGGWGAIAAGAAAAFGIGGSSNASAADMATNAAINFATTSAGGGMSIMNPASWVTAGKSLWDGFSASASARTTWMGTYTPDYGTGTWAPSTAGYVAAGAAGVYAGYNRWQNSNKDVGGALGGIAYGVGTYGLAVGASAAFAGGAAAGLAAIPVVGWIALAAMAVDMISGGKLFGTKGKLHHSNLSLDVGAEGIDLAQSYTLKGQKAFFGGTKWTTKDVDPSDEAVAAAKAFYQALLDERTAFATAFNAEVGTLIGGTWQAEYDKKGNLTSSSAEVMGVTYEGASQEDFGRILVAENMIDVLTQFDEKIAELAASVRGDIDALEAYAQQYASAVSTVQAAIESGMDMLAIAGEENVAVILDLARAQQAYGETIDQTVQRLLQAQASYDEFVAQFATPTVYVDDFEQSLSNIHKQLVANIDQANALARAAGAEGAATEDLIRIHEYAARQFAEALAQLEATAQDLAFNLGLTNIGSYDAVTAEIQRLQAIADSASQPVRDFGSAIAEAAQRASDAINLLIGDLSPLNDLEKLEVARSGLMQGTVSQEDFLEIARRLFGSSRQYEREFAFAQQYPGASASVGGSSGGGGSSGSVGLTEEERKRLEELLELQAQMQATMQLQQYQTLAQQIAEIAMAREIDWREVAESMGIDLEALAQGLGLENAEALDAYIEGIEAQRDSDGENTALIVDKLDEILQALLRDEARRDGGAGDVAGDVVIRPPTGPGERTVSPNGGRTLTDEDAEAIGESVGRRLEPIVGRGRPVSYA